MKTNKTIHVQELGQQPYKTCWDYQEKLFQGIIDLKRANRNNDSIQATPNYLLFVEHPPVFTLGKSGKIEHLLLTEQQLTETLKEHSFVCPEGLNVKDIGLVERTVDNFWENLWRINNEK